MFVAILGRAFLHEHPSRTAWLGMGLAIAGTAVITGADFALDRRALVGDLLALGVLMAGVGAVVVTYFGVVPFRPVELPGES